MKQNRNRPIGTENKLMIAKGQGDTGKREKNKKYK